MARIRTIKPSFWGDESVTAVSRDARLLLVGLISMSDDAGRFLASITAINGYVFPHDELPPGRVRKWLGELEKEGLVHLYTIDGRHYGCFLSWHKHQRINRPQASVLPAPQGVLI